MKRFFKWLAVFVVLAVIFVASAAYWLLGWDDLPPPELPGVITQGSLEHEGRSRTWQEYVPRSLADKPALLLVLHGSKSDPDSMRRASFYSFDVLAERQGLLVVYPQGIDQHWNDCRDSASYRANTENVDDVGFLRALVAEMVALHGVSPEQVYATGLSNGGHMSFRLALEAPDLVAGIAPFAANFPVQANLGCEPSNMPVPVVIVNGTEDPINPYDGGLVEVFGDVSRGEVRSSLVTARYWARLAGHAGAPQHAQIAADPERDTTVIQSQLWSAPGAVPVQLLTVVGGGHTIPNPVYRLPRILGPTSHQADGAELIWSFFESVESIESPRE